MSRVKLYCGKRYSNSNVDNVNQMIVGSMMIAIIAADHAANL